MPIDVSASSAETARLTIEQAGEQAWIDYYPNLMTAEWSQDLAANESDALKMCDLVCEVIADWDILANGRKCPIDGDEMKKWPVALIGAVVGGMMEESMKRTRVVRRKNDRKRGSFRDLLFGNPEQPEDGEDGEGGGR